MVNCLYTKLSQIIDFSCSKTESDLESLQRQHPKISSIASQVTQERYLHTLGLLYSILKNPKDLAKYEMTSRALLGKKYYILKNLGFAFGSLLQSVQSIAADGWNSKVWKLFEQYYPCDKAQEKIYFAEFRKEFLQ